MLRAVLPDLRACFAGRSGCGVRRAKAVFSQWVRDPPGYRSSRHSRLCEIDTNGRNLHFGRLFSFVEIHSLHWHSDAALGRGEHPITGSNLDMYGMIRAKRMAQF